LSRPVQTWNFALDLGGRAGAPLFQQISRAIADEIRRGRLRAGVRLPGSRTLARTLLVNRNTVIAAYEELAGEGWIESSKASGTFVSRSLPDVKPRDFAGARSRRRQVPSAIGFDVAEPPLYVDPPSVAQPAAAQLAAASGLLSLSTGSPDVRLAPIGLLTRTYRRAMRRHSSSALEYGYPHGHPYLRGAIATMLSSTRGLATTADDVVVTAGSQMALELTSRTLFRPGDVVVVEQIGYRPAWLAFQQHGAKVVPLPVDAEGLDIEALTRLCQRTHVRAVYVTPHHQYPTTATLTAGRRIALLELAKRLRFAIIEDDYDHEYHYDGRPILPLASADRAGVVVYIGTLAKVLAPGVRLGYVVAPRPLVDAIAAHRRIVDRQGDHTLECAVAQMLDDGDVQRHARRARRVYQARRDSVVKALRADFSDCVSFTVPAGGVAIWCETAAGIDVDAWAQRARQKGLLINTARHYSFDGRARPYFRVCFASLTTEEMADALRRLQAAL
jgi:GntR family transcriptional regulator / MocR family aminotransferase